MPLYVFFLTQSVLLTDISNLKSYHAFDLNTMQYFGPFYLNYHCYFLFYSVSQISNSILSIQPNISLCSCNVSSFTEVTNTSIINTRYRLDINTTGSISTIALTAEELKEIIILGSNYVDIEAIDVNMTTLSTTSRFGVQYSSN